MARLRSRRLFGVRRDSRMYTAPITNKFPLNDRVETISMTISVKISPLDMPVKSVESSVVGMGVFSSVLAIGCLGEI